MTEFRIFKPRSPSVVTTLRSVDCCSFLFLSLDSAFLRSGSPSRILSNLPSDAVDRCVAISALMVESLPRSLMPWLDCLRSTGTPVGKGASRSALPPSLPAFRLRSILFMVRFVVPLFNSPTRSALRMRLSMFLFLRAFFSSRIFSHGSAKGSSLGPTSMMGHERESSFAFWYPVRYIHSPVVSSNTLRDRFSLLSGIPLAFANCSHFVSCLGAGGGSDLGKRTSSYVGKVTIGPASLCSIGSFHNASINLAQPSDAFSRRNSSLIVNSAFFNGISMLPSSFLALLVYSDALAI
mmetsp:Transcript_13277/g.36690  ORF Transcript_13277/g.36690 Transcript_13277/m.36690 type:complete len:294 (-) Transcript_13277:493-1374(-)